MIDPHLHDWWSNKRLTELRYKGTTLTGAGISLQVITPALEKMNRIWFSRVCGEFNDNLLLVGLEKVAGNSYEKIEYQANSSARNLYGETLSTEYIMSETMFEQFVDRDSSTEIDTHLVIQVHVHDNCFLSIEPTDEIALSRLIDCVLDQHAFYLRYEIDWSDVCLELQRFLLEQGKIELQSDPKQQLLWIPQIDKNAGAKESAVLIENGKAHFREKLQ
jgi:hypothetical protein